MAKGKSPPETVHHARVEVKIQVFKSMALHGVHMGSRFTFRPLYLKGKQFQWIPVW